MTIKEMQERAYDNKVAHSWNVNDVPLEFCLLNRELGEAFEAFLLKKDTIGEELADIAIYLFGLSEILGVDLEKEVISKMQINEARVYIDGDKYKIKAGNIKLENSINFVYTDDPELCLVDIVQKFNRHDVTYMYAQFLDASGEIDSKVVLSNFDGVPSMMLDRDIDEFITACGSKTSVFISSDNNRLEYLYNKYKAFDAGFYVYVGNSYFRRMK